MKLDDLSRNDLSRIEHEMKLCTSHKRSEPILDPPSRQQLLALRQAGYFIGPNQEVMRPDSSGMLRECYLGLPCRWICGGLADGKCKQTKFPDCGVPDGACIMMGEPCGNTGCPEGEKNAS